MSIDQRFSFLKCYLHLFMVVRTKIIGHYSLFVTHYSLLGIQTPHNTLTECEDLEDYSIIVSVLSDDVLFIAS